MHQLCFHSDSQHSAWLFAQGGSHVGGRRTRGSSVRPARFLARSVRQLLPPEEARRLHAACAECLEGLVDTSQYILHHEQARRMA